MDEAIDNRHWRCAKLLMCYGAEGSYELAGEARAAIENESIQEIRQSVSVMKVSRTLRRLEL